MSLQRVVLFRAPEDVARWRPRFEAAGYAAVALPVLSIEPGAEERAFLESYVQNPGAYVIVTSAKAVGALRKARKVSRPEHQMTIIAMGPGTAEALTAAKIPVTAFGSGAGAKALVSEMASAGHSLAGNTVLWPTSDRALDELPRAVAAAQGSLQRFEVYRTRPKTPALRKVQEAVDGAVACLWFSPSGVASLNATPDALSATKKLPAIAAGPTTAKALEQAGFPYVINAVRSEPDAMIAALGMVGA